MEGITNAYKLKQKPDRDPEKVKKDYLFMNYSHICKKQNVGSSRKKMCFGSELDSSSFFVIRSLKK